MPASWIFLFARTMRWRRPWPPPPRPLERASRVEPGGDSSASARTPRLRLERGGCAGEEQHPPSSSIVRAQGRRPSRRPHSPSASTPVHALALARCFASRRTRSSALSVRARLAIQIHAAGFAGTGRPRVHVSNRGRFSASCAASRPRLEVTLNRRVRRRRPGPPLQRLRTTRSISRWTSI